MNFNKYHVSKNLFDGRISETNKRMAVSTGGSYNSQGYSISEYIPINGNTNYIVNLSYNSYYAIYDANKAYIFGNDINANKPIPATYSNARFVRFDFKTADASGIMLNEGSTAIPYEPYSSEVWHDTPHYIHNTSTDTITTPADIYANDTTATVGLKGNMSQTVTPSPTTPIQPSECGEKTGNLFDGELNQGSVAESSSVGTQYNLVISYKSTKRVVTSNPVVCHGATVTWNNSKYWICICYFDKNLRYIGNNSQGFESWITTGVHEMHKYPYAAIAVRRTDNAEFTPEDASDLNLVVDTYKIPISSANTTTPVYLGEVQTTRKIKKLVLDGTENISINAKNDDIEIVQFVVPLSDSGTTTASNVKSTHFVTRESASQTSTSVGVAMRATGVAIMIGISFSTTGISASDSFAQAQTKIVSYLAAQYAAGTPVTIWYVLASPTTGIVNEPIRKIGDYADEVSGIIIPTIAGANTLSIGTTLQPSEVTVMYKGWHPVTDVHEKSRNLLPPPSQEQSGTLNGITYYVHADGSVDLSGIAEADLSIAINLANEFTIPVSTSQGGGGTIALNNSFTNSSSITLLYNSTIIDSWGFTTTNRTATSYSVMANKTINGYRIGIVSGTNLSSGGKVGLAFSNNGTPVTPYQPYWT